MAGLWQGPVLTRQPGSSAHEEHLNLRDGLPGSGIVFEPTVEPGHLDIVVRKAAVTDRPVADFGSLAGMKHLAVGGGSHDEVLVGFVLLEFEQFDGFVDAYV